MTKTKLNILPAPTFGRLGVNFVEREAAFETERLDVPENSQKHIVQFVGANAETSVTVGKNARLSLVQIFTGNRTARLKASVSDSARFELIQLYHGCEAVSEIIAELRGYKAAFAAELGYELGSGDALDLNLAVIHSGRKSTSEISANGVLRGDAKKTFKGTIDFKKGASGAKGSEKEDVILLGETAVNKTVPVILCAEEDVEGSHGATIGRIDERHVFYMRSRGVPEEMIYELLTRARLRRVINKIGDEKAEKRVRDALGWGEDNE